MKILNLGAIVLVLGTILMGASSMAKEKDRVAYTNPKTGITTFKDPAADPNATADEAAVAAPSTATSFAPVNPQVHPRDDFFGFRYNYSPEELAGLGYQFVPEATTSRFKRIGDDRERITETTPAHYIDSFSREVDPFRNITPGSLDELRQYGLWQNLSDPNAPLYDTIRAKGATPTPDLMAKVLLQLSGLGTRSTPEEWERAFSGMTVSPELAAGIRSRLTDIARNRAENTGGMLGNGGFLGTGISTGNATLDQILSFAQGAQMGGNIGGQVATGNFDRASLEDAALQDALTLGSAALGPTVSGLTGGGMLGTAVGGAAGGALNALGRGEDNLEGIAQGAIAGAATAGGLRLGGQALANLFPAEAPPAPSTSTSLAESSDPLKRRGMLPSLQVADSGEILTDVFSPNSYMSQPGFVNAPSPEAALNASTSPVYGDIPEGVSILPGSFQGYDPLTGNAVFLPPEPQVPQEYAPRQSTLDHEPPPPTPEEQRAAEMSKTVERFAKFGRALAQLHHGRGQPEDAPQRQDGQSDEQYTQSLIDYAAPIAPDLSAESLAAKGLTPGTPAYYQFVMDQMDRIINQVTNGVDENGKDLASQLRTKTREELDQLERALYVRGQIGQLMGSGKYTDPFTGVSEDVIAPEGRQVNPALAAYTRGLARSADELATMAPGDARRYIGGMLDRSPDLFGMQARHDARTLQEILSQQSLNDDLKRRQRGMFGDSAFFQSELGALSDRELQALLGQTADPEAALRVLLGM